MKFLVSSCLLFFACIAGAEQKIPIATFDSGFGGYFTAKSIESEARELSRKYDARFSVTHYGDTANAPYGEKTPEQIAQFAAQGIYKAFQGGAEEVFIACNTASTQYDRINQILDSLKPGLSQRTISIIGSSVAEVKKLIDRRFAANQKTVRVGIFATPATVKNQAYPKAIAKAYGVAFPEPKIQQIEQKRWYKSKGEKINSVAYAVTLNLKNGNKIEIHQMGPGNWVDMIEHAAPADVQSKAVQEDISLIAANLGTKGDAKFDVIGEFCTHYPVFDAWIKQYAKERGLATDETSYITQGPLMAGIFKEVGSPGTELEFAL